MTVLRGRLTAINPTRAHSNYGAGNEDTLIQSLRRAVVLSRSRNGRIT